jgi:rhamnulokinase
VAGGARNSLLCRLTADASELPELPELAGPVEATPLGEALDQGRARRLLGGDSETLPALVRATRHNRPYEPRTTILRRGA